LPPERDGNSGVLRLAAEGKAAPSSIPIRRGSMADRA
jgi:hypothetical protein